jgi:methyl-accepting chemotaxis protein
MMIRAIGEVAKGADNQSKSIETATVMTHEIIKTIKMVAESSQAGAAGATEASQSAEQSRSAVEANLQRMQKIKEKVDLAVGSTQRLLLGSQR